MTTNAPRLLAFLVCLPLLQSGCKPTGNPPATQANLTVSNANSTSLEFSWNASDGATAAPTVLTMNGATASSINASRTAFTGATSYVVYRGRSSIYAGGNTRCTDSGLAAEMFFSHAVQAANGAAPSAQSAAVYGLTEAAGPVG